MGNVQGPTRRFPVVCLPQNSYMTHAQQLHLSLVLSHSFRTPPAVDQRQFPVSAVLSRCPQGGDTLILPPTSIRSRVAFVLPFSAGVVRTPTRPLV
jgi:hypothetical protein